MLPLGVLDLATESDGSTSAQTLAETTELAQHEIDLIAEFGARVAAFEIKSASAPSVKDARHLIWLRDSLPAEQFAGGVVLHTGRHRRWLERDIEAVPIAALWG